MADQALGSLMGPRWARSTDSKGAGVMEELSYSRPCWPCRPRKQCRQRMTIVHAEACQSAVMLWQQPQEKQLWCRQQSLKVMTMWEVGNSWFTMKQPA